MLVISLSLSFSLEEKIFKISERVGLMIKDFEEVSVKSCAEWAYLKSLLLHELMTQIIAKQKQLIHLKWSVL